MTGDLSLGVAGTLGPDAIARIASAAESAGFAALWVNDGPDGDSLAALAAAAASTRRLRLATGVLPVDRRPAAEIIARVADLPAERVVLGIGSGAARTRQLALVGEAADALRSATAATVMVGALGPRMRRLAVQRAAGPLLSWLSPELAADQAADAHALDPATRVALYVRTALDDRGVPRLRAEASRYAGLPSYRANFDRLDLDPLDAVLLPGDAAERLGAYRDGVDEVVLRAMVGGDAAPDYDDFIAAAAPLLRSAD